jgi:monoamine oxidase
MIEVIVIGAGAAGIAAGRALAAQGCEVLTIEASTRIGGRAHTKAIDAGPVDLGCGWLHSADRNAWVPIAEKLGFSIDRTPPFWERQSGGQDFSPQEQEEFRKALGGFFARVHEAGTDGPDAPASSLLEPGRRWNALIDAVGNYYNGAPWCDISIHDFNFYVDTGRNWRVREGYGALVARYAEGLSIKLNCAAESIDWSKEGVRVLTNQGVLEARLGVVAVSTAVLAREAIRFYPALPEKLEAAALLPLGAVEKVYLRTSEPEMFGVEGHLFGRIDSPNTASYNLRPFGRPLIEAFIAGDAARTLDGEPDEALGEFAIDELANLLGSSVRAKLAIAARSHWLAAPWIGGAYSHAKPGHADARAILVEPVADKLFFAGEACSREFFSTAHGAFESGLAASRQALGANALVKPRA